MQTGALPVRIGTRGSQLALWQAGALRDALVSAHALDPAALDIVPIRTSGDRIQDRALLEAGGKGLFTKEIEEALLAGRIDLAVHSAKDMPTFLPEGLMIGAYLEREDVRDALIAPGYSSLDELPEGARVGTASLRREALLHRARPDFRVELLRGNVPTRLKKVEAGEFHATLLAVAGLNRLGLEAHISAILPLDDFPPACGQGAVAVECRADDPGMRDMLAAIDHRDTALAVTCERAFLAELDGSCRTPVAGHATVSGARLRINVLLMDLTRREAFDAEASGGISEAEAIGREAGLQIRRRAPANLLVELGIF